ncbi:hypothetical protein [Leucobacter japonicus]|nr:hypothetical protein [Leucobacter japonicus]
MHADLLALVSAPVLALLWTAAGAAVVMLVCAWTALIFSVSRAP